MVILGVPNACENHTTACLTLKDDVDPLTIIEFHNNLVYIIFLAVDF